VNTLYKGAAVDDDNNNNNNNNNVLVSTGSKHPKHTYPRKVSLPSRIPQFQFLRSCTVV